MLMISEAEIQRSIMDFLAYASVTRWRVNLGPVNVRKGKTLVRAKNALRGFPDIAGVLPGGDGKMFVIEVKKPGGRLTFEQRSWRDILKAAGVLYILATSLEDVRVHFLPDKS